MYRKGLTSGDRKRLKQLRTNRPRFAGGDNRNKKTWITPERDKLLMAKDFNPGLLAEKFGCNQTEIYRRRKKLLKDEEEARKRRIEVAKKRLLARTQSPDESAGA